MGKFRVPSGGMGDLNIRWDAMNEEDIKEAEQIFKDLKEKGYKFVALINGEMKKITTFDKNATQILVIPKAEPGC